MNAPTRAVGTEALETIFTHSRTQLGIRGSTRAVAHTAAEPCIKTSIQTSTQIMGDVREATHKQGIFGPVFP
eukprot:m.549181 g.549181  ORF g.549181 m.549181 type:complete len:72 (+) comp22158_c1_seq105:2835-3050(+)